MVKSIIIPVEPDAPVTEREVVALEDYQAAVGGRIEPVDIPALGVTAFVHEEGLVRNLPFNSRATFLWWYHVPQSRQRAMLVGPALVVGLPDRNGDSTDIPPEVAGLLTRPGVWRVEVRTYGDPKWIHNRATYTDYFEALIWAMLTLERWSAAEDVRVVPVLPDEAIGEAASAAA